MLRSLNLQSQCHSWSTAHKVFHCSFSGMQKEFLQFPVKSIMMLQSHPTLLCIEEIHLLALLSLHDWFALFPLCRVYSPVVGLSYSLLDSDGICNSIGSRHVFGSNRYHYCSFSAFQGLLLLQFSPKSDMMPFLSLVSRSQMRNCIFLRLQLCCLATTVAPSMDCISLATNVTTALPFFKCFLLALR